MRWRTGRRSENVEDRRGMRATPAVAGGGIGTIIIVLVAMYFGVDPSVLLQGNSSSSHVSPQQQHSTAPSAAEDELTQFVSVVLADTEDTWNNLFKAMGGTYQEPKLVLFSGAVKSACGFAKAAVGPFYCPADQKVYIDLSFYQELKNRFRAPGDFAQAYVIAHEIGHHVQNLLGLSGKVQSMRGKVSEAQSNALSVRLELQADCFAGIWAHHAHKARQILEAGDVEEALGAASAIGDDRLQMQAKGYVTPDSFTHGSSEQRVKWFKLGLAQGDINQCNTFKAKQL